MQSANKNRDAIAKETYAYAAIKMKFNHRHSTTSPLSNQIKHKFSSLSSIFHSIKL